MTNDTAQHLPMPVTAPFSKAQRAGLLNLVIRAAEAEIMPRFRRLDAGEVDTKSGPTDLVTAADTGAEAMIARGLHMAFPGALIIGEEASGADPNYRSKLAEAELGFVIDPVDGTWNFAQGLPMFGTMIAACRFGRPVFALIYDPVGRDFVWADTETHATWEPRSGLPRRLYSRRDTPLNAMLGYAELAFMPPAHRAAASEAVLDLAHVSTLRCSAHQYRLLASGAVDFTLAVNLNPWDHAPGVLLCQQSGGHAAMLDGRPFETGIDSGYLLCAGDETMWNVLADHFAALLPEAGATTPAAEAA